jgi:hypothetical protein
LMLFLPSFHISNVQEYLKFWHVSLHECFKIRLHKFLDFLFWRWSIVTIIIRSLKTVLICELLSLLLTCALFRFFLGNLRYRNLSKIFKSLFSCFS